MAIDYMDSNGKLVKSGKVWTDVMVRTESDLSALNWIYHPGTMAYAPGQLHGWQLAASGNWVQCAGKEVKTVAIDYVDSSGKLVRCGKAWPEVMVRSSGDLTAIAGIYHPGTLAYTAGHTQEWQLTAGRQWVAKIALDPETAAAQAAASAERAAEDAADAAAQAAAASASVQGLAGWSLTREADDTVTIDYNE